VAASRGGPFLPGEVVVFLAHHSHHDVWYVLVHAPEASSQVLEPVFQNTVASSHASTWKMVKWYGHMTVYGITSHHIT
jgi:hypothetical protein